MITPKEHAELCIELDEIIAKGCETDARYFERLCYALQHISKSIYNFKEDFYERDNEEEEEAEWIDNGYTNESDYIQGRKSYHCSSCNYNTYIKTTYCPECGAKNIENEEEAE